MNKKVIRTLFCTFCMISMFVCGYICHSEPALATEESTPTTSSFTIQTFTKENTTNKKILQEQIDYYNERQDKAENIAAQMRELGYTDDHIVIQFAKSEWEADQEMITYYSDLLAERLIGWDEKVAKYPEACRVWERLEEEGYNEYVIAGILGNMMTECGGQTLALQPTVGTTHYGICQWSKGYASVWNQDLDYQINFLLDTIEYEINTYGKQYYKGFNFEAFLQLTDEKEAAKAFAKCYERCGWGSYTKRQNNATKALDYFMN